MEANLSSPEAQVDPYAAFARWRSDHGEAIWSEAHNALLVIGHEAVSRGFRDHRLSSDRMPAFERAAARRPAEFKVVIDLLRGWMVFRDPPAHALLRDPVRAAFTPRRIAAMEASVTRMTDRLLDGVEDRGTCDLRSELAQPLPALVVADLLGVPDSNEAEFRRWSAQLAQVVFAVDGGRVDTASAVSGAEALAGYFGELIEHYRRHPADNVLTELAMRSAGGGLSDQEIVGAAALLFFAGHETTTTLISNAIWCLFQHRAELDRLRKDPDMWGQAVEELMRFEGPAKVMVRLANQALSVGGRDVGPGDTVFLVIGAANRDPAVFEEPDRLLVDRHPNPHLGFGWGIHHCLGAPLARLEARVALRRLFERFPDLAPAAEAPVWTGGALGRAVTSVPVTADG